MKTKLLLTAFLLIIVSCQPSSKNESTNTSKLTTSDSLKVVQEIDDVINGYTRAHNEMNAEKAADYFINSPEMLVLENGDRYTDWQMLSKMIKDFCANLSTAKLNWEEKRINVFSSTAGLMTGKYKYESTLKDKKKFATTGWATILLIKQNNQWKFHQYHESYKVLSK